MSQITLSAQEVMDMDNHIEQLESACRALLAVVTRDGFTPQDGCECAECQAVRLAEEALNG